MALTASANCNIPWNRDTVRSFDQLAKPLFIQNGHRSTSSWSGERLVSVARSISKERRVDDEVLLSQKFLASETDVTHLQQSGSVIDLNTSDEEEDADDERPHSRSSSPFDRSEDERQLQDADNCHANQVVPTIVEPDGYSVSPSLTRSTRIRFRSRVRIASGFNRHRRSTTTKTARAGNSMHVAGAEGSYYFLDPESSLSGSPSSSISVPLRSRTDDEADRPGWGPLGQRVSMFTKKNKMKKPGHRDDQICGKRAKVKGPSADTGHGPVGPTETSPLLIPSPRGGPRKRISTQGHRRRRACYCSDSAASRRLSAEEVDEAFGKWPSRVLNYQWWWWHAEAVICCRCLDDSDEECY